MKSRKHKSFSNNYNKIIQSSVYIMDNYGAERQGEGKGDKRGERESWRREKWKQRTIEGAYRPRGSGGGMASQVSFPPSG